MSNSQNNLQSGKQPNEDEIKNSHHENENVPVDNPEVNILNNGTVLINDNIENDILLKVGTISDLREKEGSYEGQEIVLLGYYVSGDKSPLIYKFTTQNFSTLVDDGGAVVKATLGFWIAQFVDTLSAEDYGAKGDGITDDSLYINRALINAQVKFLLFRKKTYLIASSINLLLNKSIIGNSATLKTNSNINLILIKGDNKIDNLNLEGPGYVTLNSSSTAISGIAADSSNYISNITLNNVSIKSFAYYGILLEFCRNINIREIYINGVGYAGIMAFSTEDVNIDRGYVKNITGTSTLAYGIAFTRRATNSSLSVFPRSRNCTVKDFLVQNNPNWEAYDTHGGDNINFINCTYGNCKVGAAIVSSGVGSVEDYAPLNCTVDGLKTIDKLSTGAGVTITGALGSGGTVIEYASNCKIINCSLDTVGAVGSNVGGAIIIKGTDKTIIANNTLDRCREIGINVYFNNRGYDVCNNSIKDIFSNIFSAAPCIALRGFNNTGNISNNITLRDDTTLGTYVSQTGVLFPAPAPNNDITNITNLNLGYSTAVIHSNESLGDTTRYLSLGNGRYLITNNATPEGAITAPRGSLCIVVNGTKGSILYLKETATGSTGWSNITSVANATATVSGLVKQSAAVSDITLEDATDLPTALALVNELKKQLNAKLIADRAAGIQSS